MTDTEMILDQLKLINVRLDKIDDRFDKMDGRMDEMQGAMYSIRDELIQRMDNMEMALDTEINKVYLMAVKNAEDIQLLLPYKDKILNVSSTVDKIHELEEHQQVTDHVLASHSEAIRNFRLIKK